MSSYLNPQGSVTLGIVVPVYNTEPEYLRKCLFSLLQGCEGCTIVVVDDGSSTDTASLLRSFANSHHGIVSYVRKENGGQNSARNVGWQSASTEYVMFVDSDDQLLDGALEMIVSSLENEKPDILAFDSKGTELWSDCRDQSETFSAVACRHLDKRELLSSCSSLHGLVFRRELLTSTMLFECARVGEDFVSAARLIARAVSILKLDVCLYRYIIRPTSVIQSREYRYPLDILVVFDVVRNSPELVPYGSEMEWQAIKHLLFWEPIRIIRSGLDVRASKHRIWAYVQEYYPAWRENYYLKTLGQNYGISFLLLTHGHWWVWRLLISVRLRLEALLRTVVRVSRVSSKKRF